MSIAPLLKRGTVGIFLTIALLSNSSANTPLSVWNALNHATYISEGHQGPAVYDFFDANCPYCHALYEAWQPLIQSGRVTVRFVPVALLLPSSAPKAAAILQSRNPLAALKQFESRAGYDRRGALTAVDVQSKIALKENLSDLRAAGGLGVPDTLYRERNGSIKLIYGEPTKSELMLILRSI